MRKVGMDSIYRLAKRDPRVVFVGSDLGAGVLKEMQAEFPDRWFMEGVSEQHIIGMCAGLAMDGYIPYFNTIATFITRRCYEQVAIDVGLHNLPVRLLASGGGAVYAPLGPTHMALDDIALMRAIPNMAVVAPVDADEMYRLMDASLDWPGPLYIRFAKGGDPIVSRAEDGFAIGKAISLRDGGDVLLIGTGVMTNRALKAAELLAARGIEAGVLHVHTVKPLDTEKILDRAGGARLVVTIEEHSEIGGLGAAVVDLLGEHGAPVPFMKLALPDAFSHAYGSQDYVLEQARLQPPDIAARVEARLALTKVKAGT